MQQVAHRGRVLAQQPHRRRDARADLGHPVQHPVPEAGQQPAGEQPGHGGDLHRGQRRVAQRHRQQPDAHPQPLGPGQRGGGRGQPALQEAVLPQPQLGDPGRPRRPAPPRAAAPGAAAAGTSHPASARHCTGEVRPQLALAASHAGNTQRVASSGPLACPLRERRSGGRPCAASPGRSGSRATGRRPGRRGGRPDHRRDGAARPGRLRPARRRLDRARAPPSEDHRPVRARRAADRRLRAGPVRGVQRLHLQLPGAARRAGGPRLPVLLHLRHRGAGQGVPPLGRRLRRPLPGHVRLRGGRPRHRRAHPRPGPAGHQAAVPDRGPRAAAVRLLAARAAGRRRRRHRASTRSRCTTT